MRTEFSNPISTHRKPLGQLALHQMLSVDLPLPAVRSYAILAARRTYQEPAYTEEYYPLSYAPEETITEHLRFAPKYEPCDLGILIAAMTAVGKERLTDWIGNEPAGSYTRRAWFLYETLKGEILSLPNAQSGNYYRRTRFVTPFCRQCCQFAASSCA